jgi:hypothetical protein
MELDLPLTVAQWREYLRGYSAEALASDELRDAVEEGRARWLTDDQRAAEWLGFEPATEQEVLAAERRLGVRLPQTYRNFLLTSNGWNWIGGLDGYPVDLLPADRIGWFADLEGDLLEAWDMDHFKDELSRLERCLLISDDDGGVGCRWLLHADDAGQDGELTAYEWFPGDGEDPYRNDNFATLATRRLSIRHRGGQSDADQQPSRRDMPPRGRMRIDRLDHLALTVADHDAAIDFYTRVLGAAAMRQQRPCVKACPCCAAMLSFVRKDFGKARTGVRLGRPGEGPGRARLRPEVDPVGQQAGKRRPRGPPRRAAL